MALDSGKFTSYPETTRVIRPGETYAGIDDRVNTPVLAGFGKTPAWWWIGFAISGSLLMLYLVSVVKLITTGIGIFGNNVGVNAYELLDAGANGAQPVTIAKAGGSHKLVSTQMHHALEGTGEARHIVRYGTVSEFLAHPDHPDFVHPVPHLHHDLYPDFEYTAYK